MSIGFGFGMKRAAVAGEGEPEAAVVYTEMGWAEVAIPADTQFNELQALIQAKPGLGCIYVESRGPDYDYRLTNKAWDDAWLASKLATFTGEKGIGGSGSPMISSIGESQTTIHAEMDDCISDLESKLDIDVKVWTYPEHRHDRTTMRALREKGIIHARNGGYGAWPTGSNLIGTGLDDNKILESWDIWCPWEGQLQYYFDVVNVTGKTKAQLYDMLYDTANHQTTPTATELFGYGSIMEAWKAFNTWVNFYLHNTGEVDATTFGYLIEILQEDSDIWLEDSETIATYAHARHAANGTVYDDDLIYEPDADYGAKPWNGHSMAFTLSLDDPQATGIDDLAPVAVAAGAAMTIYVTTSTIEENGGSAVSVAELESLIGSGINIGGHGVDHLLEFDEKAVNIKDTDRATCKKGYRVVDDAPNLNLKFFRDSSIDLPIALGATGKRWWDAPKMCDGVAGDTVVTSWTDRLASDAAADAACTAKVEKAYQNGLDVVRFLGTGNSLKGSYDDMHDPTNGMMIFLAADWSSSGFRKIFSKYKNATDGLYFFIEPAASQWNIDNDPPAGGTYSHTDYATHWPASTFAIASWRFTLGSPVEFYINGVKKGDSGSNRFLSLDPGTGAQVSIGSDCDNVSKYLGRLGDIVVVAWNDATLHSEICDWLKGSDRWNVT